MYYLERLKYSEEPSQKSDKPNYTTFLRQDRQPVFTMSAFVDGCNRCWEDNLEERGTRLSIVRFIIEIAVPHFQVEIWLITPICKGHIIG